MPSSMTIESIKLYLILVGDFSEVHAMMEDYIFNLKTYCPLPLADILTELKAEYQEIYSNEWSNYHFVDE